MQALKNKNFVTSVKKLNRMAFGSMLCQGASGKQYLIYIANALT